MSIDLKRWDARLGSAYRKRPNHDTSGLRPQLPRDRKRPPLGQKQKKANAPVIWARWFLILLAIKLRRSLIGEIELFEIELLRRRHEYRALEGARAVGVGTTGALGQT